MTQYLATVITSRTHQPQQPDRPETGRSPNLAHSTMEDTMAPEPTFTGSPMYFFCEPNTSPPWGETAQSSSVPLQAQVEAHRAGAFPNQFEPLVITAWRPVITYGPGPLPVSGPTPEIVEQSLISNQTMYLRRQSPSKPPMIRTEIGLQKGITYVVSGQWIEGISTTPLTIEAGGYFEISAQARPALIGTDGQAFSMGDPNTTGFDPNNRFTADVVVTGTYADPAQTWPRITLGLVLNVIQMSQPSAQWLIERPPGSLLPPSTATFLAGETSAYLLNWAGSASLWPYEPDDYYQPIEHVLGPVAGNIITPDLLLSMSPSPRVVVWSSPPTAAPEGDSFVARFNVTSQVTAVWYAGSTNGTRKFTLMQTFFNGSINRPSKELCYEITADPPIVSG